MYKYNNKKQYNKTKYGTKRLQYNKSNYYNRPTNYTSNNWIRRLPLTGFPKTKLVRLRYCQEFSLNPSTGTVAEYVFRANSLFDPDYTGTGHQPSGFDENMIAYDHYTVLSSKLTIRFTPNTTSNFTPGLVNIILTDSPTPFSYTTPEQFLESRQASDEMLNVGILSGLPIRPPQLTKYYSAKRFFGPNFMDSKYMGSESTNPSEIAYFQVLGMPIGNNDPAAMIFLATIEYVALLSEPKQIASS